MTTKPLTRDWKERAETVLQGGSYEDVCELLDSVVMHLETGGLSLSEGLDFYELGVRLSERGELLLTQAELRISQLDLDDDREDDETDDDALFEQSDGLDQTAF